MRPEGSSSNPPCDQEVDPGAGPGGGPTEMGGLDERVRGGYRANLRGGGPMMTPKKKSFSSREDVKTFQPRGVAPPP